MKAVRLIHDQGLKRRMAEPESFISRINALCMEMTHARNPADRLAACTWADRERG